MNAGVKEGRKEGRIKKRANTQLTAHLLRQFLLQHGDVGIHVAFGALQSFHLIQDALELVGLEAVHVRHLVAREMYPPLLREFVVEIHHRSEMERLRSRRLSEGRARREMERRRETGEKRQEETGEERGREVEGETATQRKGEVEREREVGREQRTGREGGGIRRKEEFSNSIRLRLGCPQEEKANPNNEKWGRERELIGDLPSLKVNKKRGKANLL